jgi:superfamily I DNA and/or RNA helicase
MKNEDPFIEHLINCIELEEKEEAFRYDLASTTSLKLLKGEGLAIHPISIKGRSYGYADYPEFSFRIPYPTDTGKFRDGSAVEVFIQNEEPIRGTLLMLDGNRGEVRLFSSDFPDWLEDDGTGIKISPDSRTADQMKKALKELPSRKESYELFKLIHSEQSIPSRQRSEVRIDHYFNGSLNESQQNAVRHVLSNGDLLVLHGPPGTGKTTTIIESMRQLVANGKKVLVAAPSNAAVEHISKCLIETQLNFLRVGNNAKVSEEIFPYTPEGKLSESRVLKEIKKMKIRAEELRKMANQYKRRFGKEEREQRNLLLKEVKAIRTQIKQELNHSERVLFQKANIILGTPIGLQDEQLKDLSFDTLFIDEAGQCLEPLAWCIIPLAERTVLCGDHLQLPPTVLSELALKKGYGTSILEKCYLKVEKVHLLDTQYRMKGMIVQFPNERFYEGKLKTPKELLGGSDNFIFYDTAGAGFEEETGTDGSSLINQGEVEVIQKIIEQENIDVSDVAVISPYSAQVSLVEQNVDKRIRTSTVDSFQGQEKPVIILSLVRSNTDGQIGFLKDYRRMNVAMTRAKEKLIIIGDSSTIGADPFYADMLNYAERISAYRSIWEILY